MICDLYATFEEKTAAIHERTPDQKMDREGVPVSIGGEIFEVRPLVRKAAREFRSAVKQWIGSIDAAAKTDRDDVIGVLDLTDEGYMTGVLLAIPELAGREAWLDDNATTEELEDAFQLAMVFINPNHKRAQANGTNGTAVSVSPASTPSSASSTPLTPLQPLKATSPTSK